jgi:hypothetical protein
LETIRVNSHKDVPENFTGISEYANGTKEWYKDGKIHREDGPAIERKNGLVKAWCFNGVFHRTDGPAIERLDGNNFWYLNGNCYNSIDEYFEALTPEQRQKFIWSEYFENH